MSMENTIDHQSSIDWRLSIKLANNNKELAKELLEIFLADLPDASGRIHQAYDSESYDMLQRQVHKLHGSACYCGVTRLQEILTEMEFIVKEKNMHQFGQVLEQFDLEVNNILSAYKFIEYI